VEMTYTAPADLDARRSRALTVGVAGLAVCPRLFVAPGHLFRAWLVGYLLFGIALGSMALMMIQHVSGGAWGVPPDSRHRAARCRSWRCCFSRFCWG
jgi:hypothetical protein